SVAARIRRASLAVNTLAGRLTVNRIRAGRGASPATSPVVGAHPHDRRGGLGVIAAVQPGAHAVVEMPTQLGMRPADVGDCGTQRASDVEAGLLRGAGSPPVAPTQPDRAGQLAHQRIDLGLRAGSPGLITGFLRLLDLAPQLA